MTLYQSPGVYPSEIDKTGITASSTTLAGAFAGNFAWGPVDESVLTNDPDHLEEVYWKPDDSNYKDWFIANEFLSEASGLRITRVIGEGSKNAIVGGIGSGLTVDINAINGEVTSAAINIAGTNYTVGDIVEIETGTINAEIRILKTGDSGAVTSLQLVSSGTGYLTGTDLDTISRSSFVVKNDYDFEDGSTELPALIAKFPGELGNSLGVSVLRASEFYGSYYRDRFVVPPASDNALFDSAVVVPATTSLSYTLPEAFVGSKDVVVTFGNSQIDEGNLDGQWTVSRDGNGVLTSQTLTLKVARETFPVPGSVTDVYTLANPRGLDMFASVAFAGTTRLVSRFDGTGPVPKGYYDIDPATKTLYVGSKFVSLNGDGVTKEFYVTTADTVAVTDFIVYAGTTKFTSAAAANIGTMKVGVTAVAGGYKITFPNEFVPIVGTSNVVIKWGFDSNIVIQLGVPNSTIELRAFTNQTEVHVVVFDTTGKITGEVNSVIEPYSFLSTDPEARKEDGSSNYYVKAVNELSNYIRIPYDLITFGDFKLSLGSNGGIPSTKEYANAYEIFRNKEDYEVTYIIDPVIDITLSTVLLDISTTSRQDSVSFVGYPAALTVNNKNSELRDVLLYDANYQSSSYIHKNPTWIYIYDRFNGKYRWIPSTGTDAGLYARTHATINMWNVPAGYNRGYYRRALKASWLPRETERDTLVANRINVIVREKGVGILLLSQRTGLRKESVFADMNVRFLSIHIKKISVEALKFVINEINDEVTRAQVRNTLNPRLSIIKAGRGLYAYKVKCDGDNNTAAVIQTKVLKVDMYLKPALLIDGVDLKLIYTQTGVSFEESAAS